MDLTGFASPNSKGKIGSPRANSAMLVMFKFPNLGNIYQPLFGTRGGPIVSKVGANINSVNSFMGDTTSR